MKNTFVATALLMCLSGGVFAADQGDRVASGEVKLAQAPLEAQSSGGSALEPTLQPLQPLKLSTDLHFVVPFADGRVRLGPKGREALDRLAEVAVKAERVQIKGWAGAKTESTRNSMAFNRAYTVQYQLAKRGINKDVLRIMKPELSIAKLNAEGVATPQVVATLLMAQPEKTVSAPEAAPKQPAAKM